MYARDFQWNYALTKYIPGIADTQSERFNGHQFFISIAVALIILSRS